MKVFVTGASGFLGKAVVRLLFQGGYKIVVLGRSSLRSIPAAEFIPIDLATGAGLETVPWRDCAALIHLAAAGVKASNRHVRDCIDVNIIGTARLLHQLSVFAPAATLIYAQTYYEDFFYDAIAFQNNPYVMSKAIAGKLVQEWARPRAALTVQAKIFQVYGPGDNSTNVVPYTLGRLLNNLPVVLSSGKSEKDWIYVDDAASAFTSLLKLSQPGFKSFDIGTGQLASVRSFVELAADVACRSRELLQFNPSLDRADTEVRGRATTFVPDWLPKVSCEDGLKRTLESIR